MNNVITTFIEQRVAQLRPLGARLCIVPHPGVCLWLSRLDFAHQPYTRVENDDSSIVHHFWGELSKADAAQAFLDRCREVA